MPNETMKHSDQFRATETASGKVAIEAYVAVWMCGETHIMIGAPTLERLENAYPAITKRSLVSAAAQRVWLVKFDDGGNAPARGKATGKIKCSACTNVAEHLIDGTAYCQEHRP